MATTYLAANGKEQLDQVQAELYEHLLGDAGGRCTMCAPVTSPQLAALEARSGRS
jgi:hypothetical protein